MSHLQQQKDQNNQIYLEGSRSHVLTADVAIRYIVSWRVKKSLEYLMSASKGCIDRNCNILVLCSGEGLEGSLLCDMGFTDVTISDLAEKGVEAALGRDSRLKGLVLNAENTNLENESFDVVLVQDGLHHLSSPVQGLTEMLRVSKKGVVFLEPHNSLSGRILGREWEENGSAVNYVFRWDRKLMEQVISSYLGRGRFEGLSFSFWHHNLVYAKISEMMGPALGLRVVKVIKMFLDKCLGRVGNQFCGVILKKEVRD